MAGPGCAAVARDRSRIYESPAAAGARPAATVFSAARSRVGRRRNLAQPVAQVIPSDSWRRSSTPTR